MNRRDILHRLAGVACVLGAGASTLLHREVWLTHASGPATGLEAVLGLLTFVLASAGVLLVIGGAGLRDGWKRGCDRAARRREQHGKPDRNMVDGAAEHHRVRVAAVDSMAFADSRAAIGTFLAMRARQAARDAGLVRKTTTEKHEPGARW